MHVGRILQKNRSGVRNFNALYTRGSKWRSCHLSAQNTFFDPLVPSKATSFFAIIQYRHWARNVTAANTFLLFNTVLEKYFVAPLHTNTWLAIFLMHILVQAQANAAQELESAKLEKLRREQLVLRQSTKLVPVLPSSKPKQTSSSGATMLRKSLGDIFNGWLWIKLSQKSSVLQHTVLKFEQFQQPNFANRRLHPNRIQNIQGTLWHDLPQRECLLILSALQYILSWSALT